MRSPHSIIHLAQIVLFILVPFVTSTVWSESETLLLERLQSDRPSAREAACAALALRGAGILDQVLPLLDSSTPSTVIWAKHTIDQIVNNATAPGKNAECQAAEAALLKYFKSSHSVEREQIVLHWLSLCGHRNTVAAIAHTLHDPDRREPVRRTLERIPGPHATKTLIRSYQQSTEAQWKAAILNSLGMRGDSRAQRTILKAMRDPQPDVQRAAILAAGHFASPKIVQALWEQWESAGHDHRGVVAESLLRVAELFTKDRKIGNAQAIYERLAVSADPQWRVAALVGSAQLHGDTTAPELLQALSDPEPLARGVAQDQLRQMAGESVTRALVDAMKDAKGPARVALIELLGERGSSASSALPAMLHALQSNDEALHHAAANALENLAGTDATQAILRELGNVPDQSKVHLLQILGARLDRTATATVNQYAKSNNPAVQVAALRAIHNLRDSASIPVVLDVLQSDNTDVRNAAAEAADAISKTLVREGKPDEVKQLCLTAVRAVPDLTRIPNLLQRLQEAGATAEVDAIANELGYLTSWSILAPIPGRKTLQESDPIATNKPFDISKSVTINGTTYQWQPVSFNGPLGSILLDRLFTPNTDCGAYLYVTFKCDKAQPALLKSGSDDDIFCWLNGELVHKFVGNRGQQVDRDSVEVKLKSGINYLLIKVLNDAGGWSVCVRFTDPEGKPLQLK